MGGTRRRRGSGRILSAAGVLLWLVAGAAAAGASEGAAQSSSDGSPHSEARLISDVAAVVPGQAFTLGIHVTLEAGWHTYWKSAGDAGTTIQARWSLPAGIEVDSLLYPEPERIPYPPLVNYGYNDEVVFLVPARASASLRPGETVRLAADLDFLVCEDVCIPATARVALQLPVAADPSGAVRPSGEAELIVEYRDRLPIRSAAWALRAARTDGGFVLGARPPEGWPGTFGGAYFFPVHPAALDHTAPQPAFRAADGEVRLRLAESPYLDPSVDRLEGVLVLAPGSSFDASGHRALAVSVPIEAAVAATWAQERGTPIAAPVSAAAASAPEGGLSLLAAILFALIGGVILNLMPCVFPVLSLKALGFASRGGDRAGMRRDGLAFGAGVVLSFLAVAGVLLVVRSTGAEVGWGYQLQSPAIVATLAALMVAIGLVLLGTVEVGTSLTRLGGLTAARPAGASVAGSPADGLGSSFLTGVLATVVATPCTAPFMGAAIGTALVRPPIEGLAVFAGLGLGMAAPYVALSFWPALARRLPRPGRWMETFKQVLAFPMFAVAIWLVWVFGLQVGIGGAARLLFALLLLSLGLWILGRWPAGAARRQRVLSRAAAAATLVIALLAGVAAARGAEPLPAGGEASPAGSGSPLTWEPFSQEAVATYRAAGRAVFVDFTAAWCISCQVNERVALDTRAVRDAFAAADVATLKADWTRRDPEITRTLASFGRSGVPLYVLYPADPMAEPVLLPTLLTQGIVLDALAALPPAPVTRTAEAAEAVGAGT